MTNDLKPAAEEQPAQKPPTPPAQVRGLEGWWHFIIVGSVDTSIAFNKF